MARSVNKVLLLGYVGGDPEVRMTQGGKKVVSFSLATDRGKEGADWHRVVAWNGTAEFVERHVQKGTRLFLEGEVQYREAGGRTYTNIVARSVTIISGWAGSSDQKEQANPFEDGELPF